MNSKDYTMKYTNKLTFSYNNGNNQLPSDDTVEYDNKYFTDIYFSLFYKN